MPKGTEKLLDDYKTNKYNNIPIPKNIDSFIEKGIQKKNNESKALHKKKITAVVACFIVFLFLTAIRISPAFASHISNIPGFDYIVKLVRFDKGLQLAIENEFIHPLGVSQKKGGITLTIDYIIVDEDRIVAFYTINTWLNSTELFLENRKIRNEQGQILPASITANSGKLDITFYMDKELPDVITLETQIATSIFEIDIPINKQKFNRPRETYFPNEVIVLDGNNYITVEQISIRPTLIELDIAYDKANLLSIFSTKNLRLVDGNGEEWEYLKNYLFSTPIDDNVTRFYLESPYFTYPKELYLEGDGVYALSKDQLEVVVDLEKGEILSGPDSLKLESITNQGPSYKLHFVTPTYDELMQYTIFHDSFTDSKGKKFSASLNYSSPLPSLGHNEHFYYIPRSPLMDTIITIPLGHYPNLVYEPFRVRVK